MSDKSNETVQRSLFHRIQGSIFVNGKYTYRVSTLYDNIVEPGLIFDEDRLKKRLLNRIVRMNNDRVHKYPKVKEKEINNTTPLELHAFLSVREHEGGTGGIYSLYPLEFICNKCGKIYSAKNLKDLSNIPSYCTFEGCGGKIEQNTIVMYCEECGRLDTMNCYCRKHGNGFAHINRKIREDISTWEAYCSECKKTGGTSVDFMRYQCSCKGKRTPLPVRDGGVISPVVLTYVDLEYKPCCTNSEYIRVAIDCGLITYEGLKNKITELNISEDIYELVGQIVSMSDIPLGASIVQEAMSYINSATSQIRSLYAGVDIDELNDIHSILKQSKSYDDYCNSLPMLDRKLYGDWYQNIKDKYGILEIRYVENLKIVRSAIGVIVGINKFYEDDFIPHFVPFKKYSNNNSMGDKLYSIVSPISTEGILFRLDPLKVCNWLKLNDIIQVEINDKIHAMDFLCHMNINSEEYGAVKTLVHTFSHLLIKQSSIHTGLDEETCAEMLFPYDASILIYSTSNVNIGGFDYAFKYSIPNWFSRMMIAAEDCTFDPTCMNEGGKCFSCIYVAEFVCSNFNKELSRQTLIGRGHPYEHGFWK